MGDKRFETSQIRGIIDDRIDDGMPKLDILDFIMTNFNLTLEQATSQYNAVIQSYLQEV